MVPLVTRVTCRIAELTLQKDADGNVIGLILRAGTRPELKLLKVK